MASKSARRRRARANNMVPYARMRPNVTDWLIGPCGVSAAGTVNAGYNTAPTSWSNGANSTVLTSGNPQSVMAVVIVPSPASGTPSIGKARIDEIRGHVSFTNFQNAGRVTIAVAIYVSERTSGVGGGLTWDVRDPLNTADAGRDDYFYLECQETDVVAPAAETSAENRICFDLKLANGNIGIGGGQALLVTVSFVNSGAGTCSWATMFRTRIGPVA